MESFIKILPEAAVSPYALVAYAICGIVFLFAGYQLRIVSIITNIIKDIPSDERIKVIRDTTGAIVPESITAEEWIRNNKIKWSFTLAGAFLIVILVIVVVAVTSSNNIPEELTSLESTVNYEMRRTQYPLEDALATISLKVDSSKEHIKEYIDWVDDELQVFLLRNRCFDPKRNKLEIIPLVEFEGLLCFKPDEVQIPVISPLFPQSGASPAALESLDRLIVGIAFFNAGEMSLSSPVSSNKSILSMKEEKTSEDLDKSKASGVAVRIKFSSKEIHIMGLNYKFPKSDWRIGEDVTSVIDLAGKELLVWVRLGKAVFFSNEVGNVQRSIVLENIDLKIGNYRVNTKNWETRTDRSGLPFFVFEIPQNPQEILASFK